MKKAKEFLKAIMDIGELRHKISEIVNKYSEESIHLDIKSSELNECIIFLESITRLEKKNQIKDSGCELALSEMRRIKKERENSNSHPYDKKL